MRTAIATFLVLLGGILSVPASLAVWQERQFLNEDNFVTMSNDIFEDPEVQTVLANRLTNVVMERTDISQRINTVLTERGPGDSQELTASEAVVQGLLVRFARETVFRLSMDVLQSEALANAREVALRSAHRVLIAIINNDNEFIEANGDQIILNLRPLIVDIVQRLAGEDAVARLQELDVPEDAGQIEIVQKSDYPLMWTVARSLEDFDPLVPGITLAVFLLAMLISANRRGTAMLIGGTLAFFAVLALVVLALPVKALATSWPDNAEGRAAAKAVFDILFDNFLTQQVAIALIGLMIVVVAYSLGKVRTPVLSRSQSKQP